MAITCPQCAHENPDSSGFCIRCGYKLHQIGQSNAPTSTSQSGTMNSSPGSYPTYASSSSPQFSFSNPPPLAPTFISASQPFQSASVSPPPTGGFPPSPPFQAPTNTYPMSPSPMVSSPQFAQIGTSQSSMAIRRAFAGYGTVILHRSWLLNGKQIQASTVNNSIGETLQRRNIPKLNIQQQTLTERGVEAETRNYVTAQHGNSTSFIYVAPAGQDLYISRAITVKPPISTIRVIILLLMLAVIFFGPSVVSGLVNNALSPTTTYLPGTSYPTTTSPSPLAAIPILFFAFAFFLAYIPILAALIALLVRSFVVWLIEKDFWMYLRYSVLNDFQLDDIMLLKRVSDDTVRMAVQQVGLDASQITPPSESDQPKRRIRVI